LVSESLDNLLEDNAGMALVARIRILGDSGAHDDLASDTERWTNEIRSAAIDLSSGLIWLEKVKLETDLPVNLKSQKFSTGPVGELLAYIDEIGSSPDELRSLGGALEDLNNKLPRELREGKEALTLDDPEWLGGLLKKVWPMLVRRLVKKEGAQ